ncbi:hypothetical protein [uncultured Friedmanniella sp.]|uniref:hypothetical protein n=1 Tax=uncultured Friedmanniella sp. TaxID=335381 RepID=UPI0035CB4807
MAEPDWAGLNTLIQQNVLTQQAAHVVAVEARKARVSLVYSVPGVLAVGAGAVQIPIRGAWLLDGVSLGVGTAPAGSSVLVDVNRGSGSGAASTIFTTQANRPAVATGARQGAASGAVTFADGDYLTVDVDQVGSSTPGSDLVVIVWLRAA